MEDGTGMRRALLAVIFLTACGSSASSTNTPIASPHGDATATASPNAVNTTVGPSGSAVVPIASPTNFTVDYVLSKSPVKLGGLATTVFKTTRPGSTCSVNVRYKSGAATGPGLETKIADSTGTIGWSWTVAKDVTPGIVPVDVNCLYNGQTAQTTATFVVTP